MVARGTITVVVRVRPPNTWEASRLPDQSFETDYRADGSLSSPRKAASSSLRDVVQVVDDRILTFDPVEPDRSKAFAERGFVPPGTRRYKDKRFMFDRVFDGMATQTDLYDATAKPLLDPLFDGYNGTIFAYGATGCGKTHTISGAPSDPGIIYQTMADLFQRIEDRKSDFIVDISVTFLEIYNEEIRDLLTKDDLGPAPRGGLAIREDKAVKVVGLTEMKPVSAEEVKQIVILGNGRRTQSPTHANETSSRSHAVLQVHLTVAPRTASTTEERLMSTLSIIDLAGSERASATKNMGERMVEGANINKSLLALGNCINALCESGGSVRHVPYRNSKLTRLLKFSLGGNCKTVMIVCIAPASNHFDDTHNTLLYADRASKIKTKVVTRNVVNVDRHVGQYVEAINRLNIEVAELKARLAGRTSAENDATYRKKAEVSAEIGRSIADLGTKAEKARPTIIDGALAEAQIKSRHCMLDAIRARIAVVETQIDSGNPVDPGMAELSILQYLHSYHQTELQDGASLHGRVQRSDNASNLFDATLRAVAERRSDRLDADGAEMIRKEARAQKAEMQHVKSDAQISNLGEVVGHQAETITRLAGMLARATHTINETAQSIKSPDSNKFTNDRCSWLESQTSQFSEYLSTLHGSPTKLSDATPFNTSMLGHSRLLERAPLPKTKPIRRSVSGSSSPARNRRTPRKSIRSSLALGGLRHAPEKKNVQWRDETGRGRLEESFNSNTSSGTSMFVEEASASTSRGNPRAVSFGGSESDWEDVKVDDSDSESRAAKRPRLNRATSKRPAPAFSLSVLHEGDESDASELPNLPNRRTSPFTDRANLTHLPPTTSNQTTGSTNKRGLSFSRSTAAAPKTSRRRSNVGPLRVEKSRRRSSLVGHPAGLGSPKKTKRPSLVPRSVSTGSRSSLLTSMRLSATQPILQSDPNTSGDSSFVKNPKPTWR